MTGRDQEGDQPSEHELIAAEFRVCFVGDSFVAGVGDPDYRGWVGRLASRSYAAGLRLTAYNLGVRRQTTREVVARWQSECAVRLCDFNRCGLVISFGVNDTTHEDGQARVPASESADNLRRVLDGAASVGWSCLVLGPVPVGDAHQNERTADLDIRFASMCAGAGVSYVGVFDALLGSPIWMGQVREGDGAHPAAAGYEALTELVWPAWYAWALQCTETTAADAVGL